MPSRRRSGASAVALERQQSAGLGDRPDGAARTELLLGLTVRIGMSRRRRRGDPLGRLRTTDCPVIWHESGTTGRSKDPPRPGPGNQTAPDLVRSGVERATGIEPA